jgi:hypothetical protein
MINLTKCIVYRYYKPKFLIPNPEIEISVKVDPPIPGVPDQISISSPASIITDIELQMFAMQLHSKKIGRIAGGRVCLTKNFFHIFKRRFKF